MRTQYNEAFNHDYPPERWAHDAAVAIKDAIKVGEYSDEEASFLETVIKILEKKHENE